MRVRSVVIPVAIAVAAAVASPTAASAAPGCGVIVPKKLIIDADAVGMNMTLTSGCFTNGADRAWWDWVGPGGRTFEMDLGAGVFQEGDRYWSRYWFDDTPAGQWFLEPRIATAGETVLTQNSAYTQILYGSELTADVTRTAKKLTWAATATQWSGRLDKYVARPGATVAVFHQAKTGAPWTYVTSVRTATGGKADVSVSSPKTGNYRLAIAETRTVAAAYSRTIKGRV